MQFIRPRRRFDTAALALDAPLPIVVTCQGRELAWPNGANSPKEEETPSKPNLLRNTSPRTQEA